LVSWLVQYFLIIFFIYSLLFIKKDYAKAAIMPDDKEDSLIDFDIYLYLKPCYNQF